jgi:hypothetical protein
MRIYIDIYIYIYISMRPVNYDVIHIHTGILSRVSTICNISASIARACSFNIQMYAHFLWIHESNIFLKRNVYLHARV